MEYCDSTLFIYGWIIIFLFFALLAALLWGARQKEEIERVRAELDLWHNMKNAGWVVVVFENKSNSFVGEVAFVKGPFAIYEAAENWMENNRRCADGKCQLTFIERSKQAVAA